MQLLNKYSAGSVEEKILVEPQALSTIECFAKEKEEQGGGPIIKKEIFRLDDKELLVRSDVLLISCSVNFICSSKSNTLMLCTFSRYS